MIRTFQDDDLLLWEVYAAAPRAGRDQDERERARMMFHCLTDTSRRARVVAREETRTAVEERITEASDAELNELLASADPLD
jgi:hypothetical protein